MTIYYPISIIKAKGSPASFVKEGPEFFEIMDAHIHLVQVSSQDLKLERVLTLIKLGLKETACIINPEDFGPIYKMKYGV